MLYTCIMKKTISTGKFIAVLYILFYVINWLLSLPFAAYLTRASTLIRIEIALILGVTSMIVAAYVAYKRYVLPTSKILITFWYFLVSTIFSFLPFVFLDLLFSGSPNKGAFETYAQVITFFLTTAAVSVVPFCIVLYISLWFFSRR